MFKFGQKEVTTKDFYGQRQITDIFRINVNKLVLPDKVPCNNEKDVSQYDKKSAYTM